MVLHISPLLVNLPPKVKAGKANALQQPNHMQEMEPRFTVSRGVFIWESYMHITNNNGISLALGVWLATDEYDYDPDPRTISATSIMKPTRQILLRERLKEEDKEPLDLADLIPSRMGTAIHDSIEKAWITNYEKALRKQNFPEKIIDRLMINPEPGEMKSDTIPVYIEQRVKKEFRGYNISGKFDLCIDGELQDAKTTSVYAFIKGSKDKDYSLQGSIYRWLNPEKVTSNWINIQFLFTDWQRAAAKVQKDYPPLRVHEHRVELMSIEETEAWLNRKLDDLERHASMKEVDLPYCSDEDLWRTQTVYKYFSNPAKTDGRATKNFDNLAEANQFKAEKGKGVVLTIPGQVKACSYCPAFPICTQKDQYSHG
jgi:hypothetical protein